MIQVDRHTVIQILGSLMAQPSLLNDTDKYLLEKDDFPQTMDKYIFSAIYNLYTQGAEAIRTVDIVNYLDTNSKAKNLIKKENGISFLQDCENECEPKNFSYYYNNLKKLNLLKDLQRTGKDVSNIYCEDVLSPDYNKINDKFETMTPNDIINLLKSEVANYEKKFVLNNQLSESRASDNIRDLIKELKEEPEVGCPLQGDIFNTICRGGRKGKLYLRSAGTSVGKALPNYTKIITSKGWKTVGEVRVGDLLINRHGGYTQVLAVYPQEEKKQVYKIHFESGKVAECCDEHLWSFYKDGSNSLQTKELKEIYKEDYTAYSVPTITGGFDLPTKNIRNKKLYKIGIKIYKNQDYKLLDKYLVSNLQQRKELISGILYKVYKKDDKAYINVYSQKFKDKLMFLLTSVGYNDYRIEGNLLITSLIKNEINRDRIVKIEPTSVYTEMTCFYVDGEHLFAAGETLWITHNTRQMVGDCCNIAYPIRYDTYSNEWISTGNCEKVLYVMTEQDPEEIKTMILAYLTGYNEEIFLYGNYTEEHMERIKVAISIMEKYKDNVLFARIPDPSSSVIKNLFRRYNLQYGVENFFYDYIFSSPAMLEEYRDLKLPEHVCLRLFTTALKNLAVELNSFIMTSTQISGDDDPKGGFRDYKKVRGSKSIADLVDVGCIMSRPTREELQPYSEYISNFGEPNLVIDVYKNRRGRWNMVRIFCKNDLGICRRKDLFITDAQGRVLTDFNLANYSILKKGGFNDELNLYNTGEISDSLLESSCAIEPKETENLTADDIKEAFGTLAEKKDWDDML
mgnify:CR=1 FL=1